MKNKRADPEVNTLIGGIDPNIINSLLGNIPTNTLNLPSLQLPYPTGIPSGDILSALLPFGASIISEIESGLLTALLPNPTNPSGDLLSNLLPQPTGVATGVATGDLLSGLLTGLIPNPTASQPLVSISVGETVILVPPSGANGGQVIISTFSVPVTLSAPTTSPATRLSSIPSSATRSVATQSSITASSPKSSIASTTPSTFSSISSTSQSSSSSSSSSSTSTTSTTSSLTSSSSSTTITAIGATDAPIPQKYGALGVGGVAAVSISAVGAVALLFVAALYLFRRRHRQMKRPPSIYPEEAYLYDPPVQPGDTAAPLLETTEYRGAGGSIYGAEGHQLLPAVGMSLAGPAAAAATASGARAVEPEQQGLLGNSREEDIRAPEMPPPQTGQSFRSMMSGMTGDQMYEGVPTAEAEEVHGDEHAQDPFSDEGPVAPAYNPGELRREGPQP